MADREWFAEDVQVYEDGTEEYFAEDIQFNEDQEAVAAGGPPAGSLSLTGVGI